MKVYNSHFKKKTIRDWSLKLFKINSYKWKFKTKC